MAHKVGPKEQAAMELRLKRYRERGPDRPRPFLRKAVAEALPAIKKLLTEAVAQAISKPMNAPVEASAPPQETTMKKIKAKKPAKAKGAKRKTAPKLGRSEAAANLKAAKAAAPKAAKPTAARTTVPALEVAAFMAREGGASMAEMVQEFGIEAHPMRAKIHYIKHQIAGWSVENKDGRYYATFVEPK